MQPAIQNHEDQLILRRSKLIERSTRAPDLLREVANCERREPVLHEELFELVQNLAMTSTESSLSGS